MTPIALRLASGLIAVSLTPLLPLPSFAEKRVALVIGNDRYANLAALQKAVNDAEAVGNILARLGFDVIRGRDLGRQSMIDRLAELTARLEAGDTALFFYAGHGVAIGGVNYLVPTDVPAATAGSEVRVRGASIAEPDIIAEIQAKGACVAVLVLDACRDNPFPRAGTRTLGNTRGLADARPARGVFTLYSAGIGQTALDRLEPNDTNPNSVFTRVFVEQLAKPGLHIGELAIEVREKVAEIALKAKNNKGKPDPHEQTPAYYDQTIGGRVFLAGRPVAAEPQKPITPPQPAPVTSADPDGAVRRDFEFAERQNSKEVWEEFLRKHPTGIHAAAARQRLAELPRPAAPAAPKGTTPVIVAPPVVPIAPPITTGPAVVAPPVVPIAPPITTGPAVVAPPVVPVAPPITTPAVGVFAAKPLSAAQERSLKPKDTFKECDGCPEMVVVPAGNFTMGSPQSERGRFNWEGPQHRVTIAAPLAAGKFEVTFEEWDACVAEQGCKGYRPSDEGWGRNKRPVINVSWDDAKAYVSWLSLKTKRPYRLLTEAEWEYAARGGSTTSYYFGTDQAALCQHGNGPDATNKSRHPDWEVLPCTDEFTHTAPVGSFAVNPFGLYDIYGNVWEWVEDCWNDSYRGAPSDGSAWVSGSCGRRVLRGGAWHQHAKDLRSARRYRDMPSTRTGGIGFRIARTLGHADVPVQRIDSPPRVQ